MEYAVVLYFDKSTEQKINSLISKIADGTGNKYMMDNKIPGHITISLFQYDEEIDPIINIIENKLSTFNKNNIKIASIGMFSPNVLFLAPVINDYLIEINKNIVKVINIEKTSFDKNYTENQWVPHISLGVKLNEDELVNGVKVLVKNFEVLDAKTDRIGLVKCNPYREIKIWEI
jgi:2'-5' RNA ligase